MPIFLERLERVIHDRQPYAWAAAIGWNKGTIARVMKGHIPGSELLVPISWAENVRLDWLLTGRGTPYFAGSCPDDAVAAAQLRYHLQDSDAWRIYWMPGPKGFALALTMEAEIDFKGTTVSYTHLELLTGPLGAQTGQVVANAMEQGRKVFHRRISNDTWYQLQLGELGTYQLLDKPGAPLSVHPFIEADEPQMLEARHLVAESAATYGTNAVSLTPEQHQLLDRFTALDRHDQEMVEHLLERLAPPA